MSKEERFELLNMLSFKDKFFDNENKENLDSLDVVRILNHYDKTLSEFVKRDVEQRNKIADLEAKLAEKEQEINDICQNYDFQINDFSREVYRLQKREKILEKQLAEKEKEIDKLNKRIEKQVDNAYKIIQNCKELQIEQLEKVKDKAMNLKGFDIASQLKKYIDNQIKQLKGRKQNGVD